MSDTTNAGPSEGAQTADSTPKPKPPAQEARQAAGTDWKAKYEETIAESRKWEERSKANAEAAKRLSEIEDAQKSESERAADRIAAAEKAADDARREALRYKVATKFGVSDEDAELFLTGADEETLARQAERLASRSAEASAPRSPKPDPNQGRSGQGAASTADQFAATVGGLLNNA